MADPKNRKKADSYGKRSTAARLMCLLLVIIMLLGVASTVLFFLFSLRTDVAAAEYTEPVMSIGITYGDSAVGSFRTYSDTGYNIWSHKIDGDRSKVKFGTINDKTLIVAPHGNLAPSGTGFAVSSTGVSVGGYRIDLDTVYSTYSDAANAAETLSASASAKGYQAFPAYLGGKFKVRIGCFASSAAAEGAKNTVASMAGVGTTVSAPSSSAVTVLTSSGQIRFEFENGVTDYLGLSPAGTGDVYMRSDSNYLYEGIFAYKRTGNLLTVINMIGLETYIEGVLPYEISSTWHIEAQKAFAIAARSYAVGNKGKHYKDYGFDLCSATNCQVYRGAGSVTDTVKKAVSDTSGKILTYNGKVATLYYSSSTGGCTVSAKDCWGGTSAPYLAGISTPWERYADYSNGLWTAEVSPAELCEYLRGKGYTTLTGSIASVKVTQNAENSSYVKEIVFTDTSGNTVTITNTDKIRTALSKYVKSANFVVGQGSVAYTVSKVVAGSETHPYSLQDLSSFSVITSGGTVIGNNSGGVMAATGSGTVSAGSSEVYVLTADNANGSGEVIERGYTTTYTKKTFTATASGNFVFAGKGWGHGVGLSQYGTKDLAEFGYTYDRILAEYVPVAKIVSVADLS